MTIPFVLPFLFLTATAFRTREDYIQSRVGFPHELTIAHVRYAWESVRLGQAMVNSLITTSIAVVVLVAVSLAAAFWFLRHRGRVARALLIAIASLWVVPFVIYLLPLFVTASDLGLTDNLVVLGVLYAATNLPFGIFFMFAYMQRGIPSEVREAAEVDGVSSIREFMWIIVPLSKPAIGTLAALAFVWSWGDLLLALVFLQSDDKYTVTVAASALVTRADAGVQEVAAAAFIAILPLLLIFLIAQRSIARGVVTGVGK
jgi:ABC-type glycerol-3-phosphate transport system permease component